MTERELLKLALEALEEINKLSMGENAICLPTEIDTAMDAIKEALAQPEQEPVAWEQFYPEHLLIVPSLQCVQVSNHALAVPRLL